MQVQARTVKDISDRRKSVEEDVVSLASQVRTF
jgi:hypothetical protein